MGQDAWPFPVVVIDNGSVDAEGERLATEFGSPVTAVTLPRNRGVPGGYNAAMGWASANGYDSILLLNNDTVASDAHLVASLLDLAGPRVAAVGPLLVRANGSIASAGGRINWLTGRAGHFRRPLEAVPYTVDWVEGSCVLISIACAREIGGLDVEFEAYWEDADWCVRAGRAGYQCLVDPRVRIAHMQGGTIATAARDAYTLRNAIRFMRRNGSRRQNLSTLVLFISGRAPALLLRRLRQPGLLVPAARAIVDALAWNVRDAAARRGWRLPSSGPSLADPGEEAP